MSKRRETEYQTPVMPIGVKERRVIASDEAAFVAPALPAALLPAALSVGATIRLVNEEPEAPPSVPVNVPSEGLPLAVLDPPSVIPPVVSPPRPPVPDAPVPMTQLVVVIGFALMLQIAEFVPLDAEPLESVPFRLVLPVPVSSGPVLDSPDVVEDAGVELPVSLVSADVGVSSEDPDAGVELPVSLVKPEAGVELPVSLVSVDVGVSPDDPDAGVELPVSLVKPEAGVELPVSLVIADVGVSLVEPEAGIDPPVALVSPEAGIELPTPVVLFNATVVSSHGVEVGVDVVSIHGSDVEEVVVVSSHGSVVVVGVSSHGSLDVVVVSSHGMEPVSIEDALVKFPAQSHDVTVTVEVA
ncbi:hypothetical protein B7494_g7262 [Chlorociboria aeruginascens]|nr:hypothetical protein B7494_g7262 [Chlorociboria aeruginascens]